MEALVANDNTLLRVYLKGRSRDAINLTGATVSLRWKIGSQPVQSSAMNIIDATTGLVGYRFGTGELVPGVLSADVTCTDDGGSKYTTRRPIYIRVRPKT